MRTRFFLLLGLGIFLLVSTSSIAGIHSQQLSQCLVTKSTKKDKLVLIKWMFTAMARHPDIKSMSQITRDQQVSASKDAAELFYYLLSKTCLTEARNVVKFEGPAAVSQSFRILGRMAARELFANPDVANAIGDLKNHVDEKKLEKSLGITR